MKLHLVLNRDGGTFSTLDMDAFRKRAAEILGDEGHETSFDIVGGDEIEAALERSARNTGIDVMIAGGGDGTISAAARACWQAGMPLGVLPAGTMNLFARSLGLFPLDLEAALAALARSEITPVDISSVNGMGFIITIRGAVIFIHKALQLILCIVDFTKGIAEFHAGHEPFKAFDLAWIIGRALGQRADITWVIDEKGWLN